MVYLDDILIFRRSIGKHSDHLKIAFEILRRVKLYDRLHKFEVSKDGIHASPEKVKAVVDWPWPQSVHDIRSFWGFASYYRKFIKGLLQLAKPLID